MNIISNLSTECHIYMGWFKLDGLGHITSSILLAENSTTSVFFKSPPYGTPVGLNSGYLRVKAVSCTGCEPLKASLAVEYCDKDAFEPACK